MIRVFIAGNGKTDSFSKALLKAVAAGGRGYFYAARSVLEVHPPIEDAKSLLIAESPLQEMLCGFNADILVMKSEPGESITAFGNIVRKGGYLFFDPQNQDIPAIVKEYALQPVTCGINEKNTLTLASAEEGKIVVSVQREITGISGKSVEPQDYTIPWDTSPHDILPLIVAAGILLTAE